MAISEELRQRLLVYQRSEITEHHVYGMLARRLKSPENRRVLEKIAAEELLHYQQWRAHTGQDVKPDRGRIWKYYLISRLLGLTFGLKLMETGEEGAQVAYGRLCEKIPGADAILSDEGAHEKALIELLDEEYLRYTSSIVLGLNDALVELTGALAGFTLALQNTRLVALTGLITGIAAALSMAASEYLSTKSEETAKSPAKASVYTGVAYVVTVLVLVLPYLVVESYYLALTCTLAGAVLMIALFNYYIAIAKDLPFRKRFLEMAGLSLGVAALSFLVGILIRSVLGVET